ncbi:MAG: NUDIX domain-containing protein [Pseudomonas sp.]|uniref:NUDIX domain-containing protein n=1 Tax=Pseudomonas sp. TaxID=306 RepID=UPI0011FD20F9|nr:NUDIX domain-containing protein [Pseudomonas sp.]RZI76997.1 MAG: NUDIX domain-containing protein [Pseudomonas sp.]
MPPRSAGILFHRNTRGQTEVLLVHPGGPLWRNKDIGAWQMPKGLVEMGEDDEAAARREVAEELGCEIDEELTALGAVRQAGGKTVIAFAAERDFDPASLISNMIDIAWPPRSGRTLSVPEVDEARWFDLTAARERILPSQVPILDSLVETLKDTG